MSRPMHLTPDHVARTFRAVPDPDDALLMGWHRLDEAEIAAAARELLAARPAGPLHVFAYGSLLWKPEFEPLASRRGHVDGWHRSFCIELTTWRGTPEAPGLMMALLPGGRCTGLVQEVPEAAVVPVTEALIARETPFRELLEARRWLDVQTAEGHLRALTFYAPPVGEELRTDLTAEATARMIARACGHAGSNAEYLHETLKALGAHGIRDGRLWRLQKLVAAELDRMG
ncbi:gamma-glutamylcyclotransferase [Seohaeicola zhoushanensis]|nr:gamma-glutamylcyclotransferase [Seohaeicola zhoushanensis]